MRTLILCAVLLSCGAPATDLESELGRVEVACRLTADDRERLDCLYAQQDCAAACAEAGGVERFLQFPPSGEPQCVCAGDR